jgi:prefoldin subunit 5
VAAVGSMKIVPRARYKSTRDVHAQWIEDMDREAHKLCAQITALVRPVVASGSSVGGLAVTVGGGTLRAGGNIDDDCNTSAGAGAGSSEDSRVGGKQIQGASSSARSGPRTAAAKDKTACSPHHQQALAQASHSVAATATSAAPQIIPLPDALVFQILAHVNTLKSILSAHSISGLARVQATYPSFVRIMKELALARSKILAIVSAMTWPMQKKLGWLKQKYNIILEENAKVAKNVDEFGAVLQKYNDDIEAFHRSTVAVDREKHTMEYRRTKVLNIAQHDERIQQLIVDHATEEYSAKLSDVSAREKRLTAAIQFFKDEYGLLSEQAESLKAAQRSLHGINAVEDGEEGIGSGGGSGSGSSETDSDDPDGLGRRRKKRKNLNDHKAPKIPPDVSGLLGAIDTFVQTKRLAGKCTFNLLDCLLVYLFVLAFIVLKNCFLAGL